MRIQKRGLPNQKETPINIESPLNSTYIEPKEKVEQIEETKPKREKKKKKESKKIERPTLYTYTVTGCVKNSQGRFKFTDIIEAQDINIASDIYKQRAKKEFSAVRAVNKIEVNEFKEGDQKSAEEIIEELKKSDPIKDNPLTDEELARLVLNTILTINECKIYRVLYAPSKKKSIVRKAPKLYYMAKDIEEMKHDLESEIKETIGEYNEKWIQSVSVLEDNLSDEIMKTGIYKSVYRRIKKIDPDVRDMLVKFYDKVEDLTPGGITDEEKKELLDVVMEIPKILLSAKDDDSFVKAIGELKIGKHSKSVELESTDNGLVVRDTGHTDSILGKQYSLHVEMDKETNKVAEIKPIIPIIMNHDMFKTYIVHSERNGVEVLADKCKVMAESEDKASDYIVFVCKKMERIKKNDTIKTDVFLDGKQVAGYICRV